MRKNNKAEKTVRTSHVLGRGLFDTFSFFSAQILLARKLDVFTEGFTTHIHFIWLLCSFFSTHILFTSVTSWLSFTTRYVLTELYYTHTFQVCTQILLDSALLTCNLFHVFPWLSFTTRIHFRSVLRFYHTLTCHLFQVFPQLLPNTYISHLSRLFSAFYYTHKFHVVSPGGASFITFYYTRTSTS